MNVIEPGTKGYRNLSGSVDFVGTLALDPANWVTLGAASVAKGARSIKFLDEAQKAKQIADGCNVNEIKFIDKIRENKGFFEKIFNFFG